MGWALVADAIVPQLHVLQHAVNFNKLHLVEIEQLWIYILNVVAINVDELYGKLLIFEQTLSPYPASAAISGVVEAAAGVCKEGLAFVLQVDEVAVRCVYAAWREAAGRVGGDVDALACGGKNLAPYEEKVAEGAVGCVVAAWHP